MYTRADMFRDNAAEPHAAHRRYYGEIVRECGIVPSDEVLRYATREKLAADPYLNNVRNIGWWDAQSGGISRRGYVHAALKARGDYMTQSSACCLLKEAVRQHYEGQKQCDCCGQMSSNTSTCVAYGIDTVACEACRDIL